MADSIIKAQRDQIDAIDDELLRLINQRAELAKAIGTLKTDGIIYRPEREAQVLRRLLKNNQGPLLATAIETIFSHIMSQCRALEKTLAVAFLGPQGTFTEEAVTKRFGSAFIPYSCTSIEAVFQAVESEHADYGVVPVENSSNGAIGQTLDLAVQTPLSINGEITLAIHHHLLTLKSVPLNNIKTVYAHAQAFAQCQNWLSRYLPHAVLEMVSSNAAGAERIQDEQTAAIASERSAELLGREIVARNIEDYTHNTTRFWVLGRASIAPSGKDKTSLVMSAPNQPGAISALLAPLADYGVSMTKLESRPSKQGLWDYVFFVDIEGHQQDKPVAQALASCQRKATFLKILGSYPVAIL